MRKLGVAVLCVCLFSSLVFASENRPAGYEECYINKTNRVVAYIDLSVLEANYHIIRSIIPGNVKLLCVVKADAYGHGVVQISRKLEAIGVDYLGVVTVQEGIMLRKRGITVPILVMGGAMDQDDIQASIVHNLTIVVHNYDSLKKTVNTAHELTGTLKIHLKFDTGMGRLGFIVEDVPGILEILHRSKNLQVEGIMSHFASSEMRDEYGLRQVAKFQKAIALFKEAGIIPRIAHMGNSGSLTTYPEAYHEMVRIGISLYGYHSDPALAKKVPVKQVMKLASRIAVIRDFAIGTPLGYGRSYTTNKPSRIASVPLGYADGYTRALSNKGEAIIRGKKCPVVGRICMDWLLVDVTSVKEANIGDEVVFLGSNGEEKITADDLAEKVGTIPYEILCNISPRVPRIYINK